MLPQIFSWSAVSPALWNFTTLPSRKVRTSACSVCCPSTVVRASTTTWAAAGPARPAAPRHWPDGQPGRLEPGCPVRAGARQGRARQRAGTRHPWQPAAQPAGPDQDGLKPARPGDLVAAGRRRAAAAVGRVGLAPGADDAVFTTSDGISPGRSAGCERQDLRRTYRSGGATWASRSTRWSFGCLPTGWPRPRARGGRSARCCCGPATRAAEPTDPPAAQPG